MYYNKSVIRKGFVSMDNKEILKQQEEQMKAMYSGEPCHLLKGMAVAFVIEAVACCALVGVGYLLSFL